MVSSKLLLILVVVGLVVLIPITVLAVLFFPPGFMYSHHSSYSYTTSISTNDTIENVTVRLPFPSGEEVGPDLDSNLWIYDDAGNEISDWNTTIIDTAHGPMLNLHADRLVGEDRYLLWTYAPNGSMIDRQEIGSDEIPENMTNKELVPKPISYSISWQVEVDHDIETRYPVGNGTFIAPVTDVTTVRCEDPWDETENCYNFTSVTFMSYDADTPVTATLEEIRFEGWNEWGFWLSNSFNTFEASTSASVYTDGRQGWTSVDGEIHAGRGRYDGPAR